MIHILGKIPSKVGVAVSGGVDSMALLNFLQRRNRDITVLHYNHGTLFGEAGETVVRDYCSMHGLPLLYGKNTVKAPKGASMEAFWRDQRYSFFGEFNMPIITCHHLNDAVETWIFTSFHGKPSLIPYRRDNFLRPFLLNKKSSIIDWAKKNNVPYVNDPSNLDTKYCRNFIRHELMPMAKKVNPGIEKTIKKKYLGLKV